jgi:sulfate transport system ATP-binding protein
MNPASPFVSTFVGETNKLAQDGTEIHVRPHDIEIVTHGGQPVRVDCVFRKGGAWRIEALIDGDSAGRGKLIEIDLDASEPAPNPGETILIAPRRSRTF